MSKDLPDDPFDRRYRIMSDQCIDDEREGVYKMAQLGCTDKEIGHIINIHPDHVRKFFNKELQDGRGNLRRALRKAQLEAAINDKNVTMLIWLGKNYLGQKEPKHEVEHGGGITIQPTYYGQIDDEKIIQIEG